MRILRIPLPTIKKLHVSSRNHYHSQLLSSNPLAQFAKMLLLLLRQLPLRIRNDSQDERIVIAQESIPLPLIRARALARLLQESLVLGPQAPQRVGDGLVVARVLAHGQDAVEELGEALRERVRGGGQLRGVTGAGKGELGGGGARGHGGHELPDGLGMGVHGELEARPEEHVQAVEVGLGGGDLAALELEGEGLVQAHAQQDAEAVEARGDEVRCQRATEGESGFEDGGAAAGHLRVCVCVEELGEEGVLG